MSSKDESAKDVSLPAIFIGSGLFIEIIGLWTVIQTTEPLLMLGGLTLSVVGSLAILYGLMIIERPALSPTKLRKLKFDISKELKIQYPSYILKVEELQQKYQALYNKLPELQNYCEEFRKHVRNLQAALGSLDGQLQRNLRDTAVVIDEDSADGIAKKILWSEKQIQLNQLNETLETLTGFFTNADIERYRAGLTHISGRLTQLDRGIKAYRELMILCDKPETHYEDITRVKEKVDRTNALIAQQEPRLQALGEEIDTKPEKAKVELSLFQQQLDDFRDSSEE